MNNLISYRPIDITEVLECVTYAGHRRDKHRAFRGLIVHMNSIGLRMFAQKGITCVNCGVKGEYFRVYKCKSGSAMNGFDGGGYLNLIGIKDGTEILMTVDHKLPRSKGGTNDFENLQTMCTDCNNKKGSELSGETKRVRRKRTRVEEDNGWSKWASEQRSFRTVEELTGLSSLFRERKASNACTTC